MWVISEGPGTLLGEGLSASGTARDGLSLLAYGEREERERQRGREREGGRESRRREIRE